MKIPAFSGISTHEKQVCTDAAEAIPRIAAVLNDPGNARILVCGHTRPDGDCIGSLAAMYHYLRNLGKDVRLYFHGLNQENMLELLPGREAPSEKFPEDFEADVTLCLDASDEKRIVDDFSKKARGVVLVVDHHVSNPGFGHYNWVDARAAATGEMLFRFMEAQPDAWTPEIAGCLYFAILSDTGGFRYANTDAASFRAAARLVELGARPAFFSHIAWGNQKPETVRIVASVLGNLHFELEGRLLWSEITQEVYRANGGEDNDPDNLSGELRSIKGVEVSLLLREGPQGSARASIRSTGRVDVSRIAAQLGGGGHRAAAGLEIPGPYASSRQRILDSVLEGVAQQLTSDFFRDSQETGDERRFCQPCESPDAS